MIDLRKGGLIDAIANLPYRLVVPLPVREFEVLDFPDHCWQLLDESGMITYDLDSDEISQAIEIKRKYPSLSAYDCICIVTTLTNHGILLTGDLDLRRVARTYELEVHGVLWIIDELVSSRCCSYSSLLRALNSWQHDSLVFLPFHEINLRLERIRRLM